VRPETARQILDILAETPPPKGRTPGPLIAKGPRVAYKTGTSYGFRDALAAGLGGDETVVVWTGRPDGGARGGLTGREASAPLLFDVFDAIDARSRAPAAIAPSGAPQALAELKPQSKGPVMIFPPDGAAVELDAVGQKSRGLVLEARGEGLKWFVDGDPLDPDPVSSHVVWRPTAAGFYEVTVVDAQRRQVSSRVRVRAP
jgi:penicillin-binding protein 1C